jgi:hypothetical protein
MPLYQVNCSGCMQTSMHQTDDENSAEQQHQNMWSHKEYEERVASFIHGKDHNS